MWMGGITPQLPSGHVDSIPDSATQNLYGLGYTLCYVLTLVGFIKCKGIGTSLQPYI